MSAAVDECVQCAVLAPVDDDWGLANKGGLEIARLGHFRLQRHVIPHGSTKQPLLLKFVNRGIEEDRIGNPRYTFRGPNKLAARLCIEGRHVRSSVSSRQG